MHPGGSTLPVGPGIGATQPVCVVISPTRAAGMFSIITVAEPTMIIPGPLGTQDGRVQGVVVSITRAAGWLPISTVLAPLMMVSGNAGWATGVGVGAGGWIGAWQCGESWSTWSPRRAAGLDMTAPLYRGADADIIRLAVLVIRNEQIRVFRREAEARFDRRLGAHFRQFFPRQCGFLGEGPLLAGLQAGRRQAEAKGFRAQREIALYISLMFLLGAGFESDPQIPWAAAILEDRTPVDPFARLTRLYEAASDHLDRAAGANNEHLVKALLRLRAYDIRSINRSEPARFEEEMLALFGRLYPQKAAVQGEAASRALIRQGVVLARADGLVGRVGASLYLGMMFFLGSGFGRDPLVPWAGEVLCAPGLAEEEKVRRLHSRCMEFLELSLA